jgi:hypothetical protein
MAECVASCEADKCCIAQLTYGNSGTTGACTRLELSVEASAAATALYYKLLPSDAVAAFSVRGKVRKRSAVLVDTGALPSCYISQVTASYDITQPTLSKAYSMNRMSCFNRTVRKNELMSPAKVLGCDMYSLYTSLPPVLCYLLLPLVLASSVGCILTHVFTLLLLLLPF